MGLEPNRAQLAHTHHLDSKTIYFAHRGGGLGQRDIVRHRRVTLPGPKSGPPFSGGVIRTPATAEFVSIYAEKKGTG
jgi:hypothetical protein